MSYSTSSIWGWILHHPHITPLSYLCMWQMFCPWMRLTNHISLFTWDIASQTFHIKFNFRICTDDQAVCEWALSSADPCDEANRCAQWTVTPAGAICPAGGARACMWALATFSKTSLTLSSWLSVERSLLWAWALIQFWQSQSICCLLNFIQSVRVAVITHGRWWPQFQPLHRTFIGFF